MKPETKTSNHEDKGDSNITKKKFKSDHFQAWNGVFTSKYAYVQYVFDFSPYKSSEIPITLKKNSDSATSKKKI